MRLIHRIAFFLLLGFSTAALAQETVSITVLNGAEIRCYPDSLVRIQITPNPAAPFTQIFVDWGDGSPVLTINAGEALVREHRFPIAQFLDDCTYGEGCPGFASNGFCFSVAVDAVYGGAIPPENVSKRITFQFPPRPNFSPADAYICAGETVNLRNLTCPSNDPDMRYYWLLPDGSTSNEAEPAYTFPSAGTYPVRLTAANDCDSITTMRNITVNPLPIASAVLDSGSVSLQGGVYSVCLSDGGRVRFNGDGSQFETNYNWSISPSSGYTWQGNRMNDTTFVRFTAPGTYTVTLRVDNLCQQPDEATFTVEVLPVLSLNLAPQPDGCLTLSYTPTLTPGATYTLNGTNYAATDFPLTLTTSPNPYTLMARVSNMCDTLTRRDTFFVFGQSDPTITAPATDGSICRDTSLLPLVSDLSGGTWSVSAGAPLVVQGEQAFFNTNQPNGTYTITYRVGFDACEGTDTRTITINSPAVSLAPLVLCEDSPPTPLTATPAGGRFQGTGITNETAGLFDPATVGPGTYTIAYTFVDAAATGCTVTNTNTVEVVAMPTANNVPAAYSVCNVNAELSLPMLADITFSPNTGTAVWAGAGITNSSTGTYNPANVGAATDTVSFSYTVGPGCTIRDTFIVTIDDITAVDAGSDRTLCDSDMNPTLAATPAGGRWVGTGIDPVTGAINLAALTAGQTYTYMYTINADIPSCESSDAVNITIAPGQGVGLAFAEVFVCDTASVVALPAGSPASGAWSGATGISGGQVDISTWAPGTYPLTYTVAALPPGCNAADFTIHLAARPTVGITSDTTACVGVDCLPFMATGTGAAAFQWQFGDGATATDPNTCHTYSAQGTFNVRLTGYLVNPNTNARYCASVPATTEVDILGVLPPIGIDLSSTQGCPALVVDLAPTNTVPYARYVWTTVGITDSVATALYNIPFPATTEDTTYQVQMTVTNGCTTDVQTATVTALAPLRALIGTEFDRPCNGETIRLFNRSTGTAGSNTPSWTSSDGWTYTGTEPPAFQVFTDSLPRMLTFTLIAANVCNLDTARYTIEIQPTDVRARMNFSQREVCRGADLLLINQSTPGADVRWVTSDGTSYVGDTIAHRFQQVGSAWVDVFAFGCGYDSTRYYFEVLPAPVLGLQYDPFVCARASAAFTATGNATSTVLYFGNGDSTLVNGAQYAYAAPGTYTLRLIGRSTAGCLDSLQRNITILPLPVPLVVPPDSICAGETVALVSSSANALSCAWRLAGGGFRDQCITSYVFNQSGLQSNRLIVTSAQGCRDSIDFPVYVRPTPVAAFSALGSGACSPAVVSYTFTPGGPQPTAWLWDFGDGATSTDVNPAHTYAFGGNYRIQLTVSIDGICTQSVADTIAVRGTPQITALFTDERCLLTDDFIVEVLTDNENETTVSGPNFLVQGINRFNINTPGNYLLEVLSPLGCDTVVAFTVPQVFPLEVATLRDTSIELGASVVLVSQANASDVVIDWSPDYRITDTTVLSPSVDPLTTTNYTITVSRGNCWVQDDVLVTVKRSEIYFPNAFSPNFDGSNDVYTIHPSISVDTILEFKIFTRWGALVFEAANLSTTTGEIRTWDGHLRGEPLNPGTFVYWAEVRFKDGRTERFKGSIHLVR